jgi:hypothetical protein
MKELPNDYYESEEMKNIKDQGFTRPKVLILAPFK